MADPESVVLDLPDEQYWVLAYNRAIGMLDYDVRDKLSDVFTSYFAAYGPKGTRERLTGRTVAQVIREFQVPPG